MSVSSVCLTLTHLPNLPQFFCKAASGVFIQRLRLEAELKDSSRSGPIQLLKTAMSNNVHAHNPHPSVYWVHKHVAALFANIILSNNYRGMQMLDD